MSFSTEVRTGQPDPAFIAEFRHGADLHNKGMALERQGKHAEAITVLRNALGLKLETRSGQLGQLDDAEENIRKALEIVSRLSSTYNPAYYRDNLGLVYEMRGDLAEARRIRFGPTPDEYLCSYAKCQPQQLRPLKQLSKCSRCKCILYCSADCMRSDWRRHKKFCRKIE
ncbi:uncharacterized protein PHACADRAFT_247401 [Phanerochaete carnosa HHB-10118-sp]|uniref:MYND-type domain-containing protein n=1 Tax=Phanerochaete carnosa (strain HHB-10118-sp) TaxID=650164 RepID=K5VDK2_PHACS|nr:uncharacterized protein PHACADRAFT_247401 [Phanerochaete carnosa HHB-10118-sp]EKM61061.1 hypothetical protein PHACADRAFT_247401 [Phanerochaete carnosa HHB-10118-sp]